MTISSSILARAGSASRIALAVTTTAVVVAVVCLKCDHLVRLRDWRTVPEGEPQPCANAACTSHATKPKKRPYYAKDHEKTCLTCGEKFMGRASSKFCARSCRNGWPGPDPKPDATGGRR